jgi:hypothetical protein
MTTSPSPTADLLVPRRFCGPPSSGNGGWTAGALAALIDHDCPDDRARSWPTIRVALRQPPPLDTPMTVSDEGGSTVASTGGAVVARADVVGEDVPAVEPVTAAEARAARSAYPGLVSHPFPTCFACGTEREEGDGLRIFPGQVADSDGATRIAATWIPHPSVGEDFHAYVDEHPRASLATTWAALDCIGGWAADIGARLMVLGTMTARLWSLPAVGAEHVVVGEPRGESGRKRMSAASLYTADGQLVGTAEHVWIAVDPAAFN